MRPYVVRQGDYIAKVAMLVGCGEDEIWSHEKNLALREGGRKMAILHPGDVLFVPETAAAPETVATEASNAFLATIPRTTITIACRKEGAPFARQKYEVRMPDVMNGTADAQGVVTFDVPVTVREVTVTFPELREAFCVRIGDVDPCTEASGARARLAQLGYLPLDEEAQDDESLADAIARFQLQEDLAPTGWCDGETTARLIERFGC